jgi:WD40 repeat protein
MDKRLGNSVKLMVCLLITVGGFVSSSQESQTPRFGSGIIILERPGLQVMWEPNLSPSGDFVFANSAAFEAIDPFDRDWLGKAFLGGTQVLWDIRGLDPDGVPIYLDSIREEELIEWPYIKDFAGTERGPIRAFSPDGRYMAMKMYSDVSIFTIPELELYYVLPITADVRIERYWDDSLKWSPDGQLLATLVDNEIIVWDVENDIVERYILEHVYWEIISYDDGWFGDSYPYFDDSDDYDGFFTCDKHLENCREHDNPRQVSSVISPDGESIMTCMVMVPEDMVVIPNDLVERSIDFWHRQSNGQYRLNMSDSITGDMADDIGCPRNLSPDGQYITLWHDGTIQEFPAFDLISTMRAYQKTAWLPDSHHLVTFYPYDYELTMGLYEVGNDKPIDTLDLVEIFGEEKIVEEWYEHNIITEQTLDVSNDGRWVLVNLGWAVLVVPIVYE